MKRKIFTVIIAVTMLCQVMAGCGSKEDIKIQKVEHNNDYFIQVDENVYFRNYPMDALTNSALGGNYMGDTTGNVSSLMCYNTVTGETKELFKDNGNGPIVYINDRLYMTDKTHNVYSTDLQGKTNVVLEKGMEGSFILGCDDKTGTLVVEAYDKDSNFYIHVIKNEEIITNLTADNQAVTYVDCADGYIVYSWGDASEAQKLGVYDIEHNRQYTLGIVPNTETRNGFDVISNSVIKDGRIYLACGNFEGSMGILCEAAIISAKLDTMDSLEVEKVFTIDEIFPEEASYEQELPHILIEDGKVNYTFANEGTVTISETGDIVDAANTDNVIVKDFTTNTDPEGIHDMIEEQVKIGEYIYMVVNTQIRDESADIGWRMAYARKSTRYMKLDLTTGEIVEL